MEEDYSISSKFFKVLMENLYAENIKDIYESGYNDGYEDAKNDIKDGWIDPNE